MARGLAGARPRGLIARSVTAAADVLSPRSRNLQGLLFSLPLIVLFLAFVVYPLYFEVTQALDRYTYEVLFNDPIYVQTIVNTLVYVGIAVNLKLFLALLLSGVLDDDSRSTRFLSAIFLLPWAIPVLPGILSVRWMMSSQWGILNLISEDLGLGTHHWLASRWTQDHAHPAPQAPRWAGGRGELGAATWLHLAAVPACARTAAKSSTSAA